MNDRELIADTLATTIGTELDQAAAVLAALGDRLLPVLPDTIRKIESLRLSDDSWCVTVYPHDSLIAPIGYGPTIPAAIRAALESQP